MTENSRVSEIAHEERAFDEIVTTRLVRALYQPIIDLDSRTTVGWEALARGPEGSVLEYPDRLFEVAERLGRVKELDYVCQAAAIHGALEAGLSSGIDLFINVEPRETREDPPDFLLEAYEAARGRLRITLEITEREITARPAALIALIGDLRNVDDWGVALDDVGVDPRSIGLIPFLDPDIIKLDRSVLQGPMNRDRARITHAVLAEAERTGAKVLAEGIETEQHLADALALGANLGQGWLFGRPGALDPGIGLSGRTRREVRAEIPLELPATTPFEVLSAIREPREGTKKMLLQMSGALEAEAMAHGASAVLLSTFQEVEFFTVETASRYEAIARDIAFVGALAVGLGEEPAPGVRGAALTETTKLRSEWDVIVLAPHFAGAFASREQPRDGGERRFDHVITFDRALVVLVARQLMGQIAPLSRD